MAENPPDLMDLVRRFQENQNKDVSPLEQAELLQAMLDTGKTTRAELPGLVKQSPSIVSELLGYLDFPAESRRIFILKDLSQYALRKIKGLPKNKVLFITRELQQGVLSPKEVPERVKALFRETPEAVSAGRQVPEEEETAAETPLERLTSRFRKKAPDSGQRVHSGAAGGPGRPVSFLIMRALLGIVFGVVAFGLYLLSSRGHQAVVDLEKRAGDSLEARGADKITLWLYQLGVVLALLVFFWPRIRQGIYGLRHPPAAAAPQAPSNTPAATPAATVAAPAPASNSSPAEGGRGDPKGGEGTALDLPPHQHPSVAQPSGDRGIKGSEASRSNTRAAAALKAPEELHADVKTPDLIHVTWRAVGPGVTYNLYSCPTSLLSPLRKENDHLLKSTGVTWTPETGLERYWIVVTAVDAQGRESSYSEAIEVVRHPQNSGRTKFLDEAAGEVKKVLPW